MSNNLLILVLALATFTNQQIKLKILEPHFLQLVIPDGIKAKVLMWGKHDTMEDMESGAYRADPIDGCERYMIPEDSKGKHLIYFIQPNNKCSLGTQIHNAQISDAKALVIEHSSNDLDQIEVPDHISGVNIPVLIIPKGKADAIFQALNNQQTKYKVSVALGFKDFIQETNSIVFDLFFSPEEYLSTKFLSDFANTRFVYDLTNKEIQINLHHILFHCNSCKKTNYLKVQHNCFSGGRYCAVSKNKVITGEKILYQDMFNICTEKVLIGEDNGLITLMGYYHSFHKHCAYNMDPVCTVAILEKLGIKDDVKGCMKDSIVKDAASKRKPTFFLDDNVLLAKEMTAFKKVKNFNRFPLLKINGIVYYGSLNADDVLGFTCLHVNNKLKGCNDYLHRISGNGSGKTFTIIVIITVLLLFCILANECKKKLRIRFENELNYQVDQSINKFLEKNGGDSL